MERLQTVLKDRVYVVFGLICKKNSKMPVHCMAHHHHQLIFFSTPTPIKDSGAVWIVTIFAIYCHMIFATLALVELLKLLATLWLA